MMLYYGVYCNMENQSGPLDIKLLTCIFPSVSYQPCQCFRSLEISSSEKLCETSCVVVQ